MGSGVSQVGIQHLGILNPNAIGQTSSSAGADSTAMDVADSPSATTHPTGSTPRAMSIVDESGSRAPKAVVSDGEDDGEDSEEDEEENGTNKSEDNEVRAAAFIAVVAWY